MKCRKQGTSSSLRHKLTLQAESITINDIGGYTRSWKNIADVWAQIEPLQGSERLFGKQLQSSVTHRITIRYRDDVQTRNRFILDKRVFNIRFVMNSNESNQVLEIIAEEGVAG